MRRLQGRREKKNRRAWQRGYRSTPTVLSELCNAHLKARLPRIQETERAMMEAAAVEKKAIESGPPRKLFAVALEDEAQAEANKSSPFADTGY